MLKFVHTKIAMCAVLGMHSSVNNPDPTTLTEIHIKPEATVYTYFRLNTCQCAKCMPYSHRDGVRDQELAPNSG